MFSKSKQKYILSLQRKKIRQKEGIFIAEGKKTIETLIQCGANITEIFCVDIQSSFLKEYTGSLSQISEKELKSVSSYSNPDDGIALVKIPKREFNIDVKNGSFILFLDQINDPGNMGTIIRLADWFGITQVLLNKGNVDPFQSKCVQSSMGAIGNVEIFEVENSILEQLGLQMPIVSTKMDGVSVNNSDLPESAVLVMGNEANGVSENVLSKSTHFISIPKHNSSQSESLNVAMACGIFLSHFVKL